MRFFCKSRSQRANGFDVFRLGFRLACMSGLRRRNKWQRSETCEASKLQDGGGARKLRSDSLTRNS